VERGQCAYCWWQERKREAGAAIGQDARVEPREISVTELQMLAGEVSVTEESKEDRRRMLNRERMRRYREARR
jgi:hypothetical protein